MSKRTRRITWDLNVCVYNTLHINDYTDHEVASSWLSIDEYRELKKEMRRAIEQRESRHVSTDNACMFDFLPEELEKKRRRRKFAADVVFLEQDIQDVSGRFDQERIAKVYGLATIRSQKRALEKGLNLTMQLHSTAAISKIQKLANKISKSASKKVAPGHVSRPRSISPKAAVQRKVH